MNSGRTVFEDNGFLGGYVQRCQCRQPAVPGNQRLVRLETQVALFEVRVLLRHVGGIGNDQVKLLLWSQCLEPVTVQPAQPAQTQGRGVVAGPDHDGFVGDPSLLEGIEDLAGPGIDGSSAIFQQGLVEQHGEPRAAIVDPLDLAILMAVTILATVF